MVVCVEDVVLDDERHGEQHAEDGQATMDVKQVNVSVSVKVDIILT